MYCHFLGIPGCAKSALCKEILSAPGGLGDDRPVRSLMGDLIKGIEFDVSVSLLYFHYGCHKGSVLENITIPFIKQLYV